MPRICLSALLCFALSLVIATPALAGEKIEGDGYEVRLPDGFKEMLSIENAGNMKVTSRFGNLPIDGMPEIKAYTIGNDMRPDGMVMLARINLTRSITSVEELGMNQIEKLKSRMPEGMTIQATKVGTYHAIEMSMVTEAYEGDRTARVLSIAAGDYVVVVMLDTSDQAFPNASQMWSTMTGTLKIEPGVNKLLLFGLVGVGGLLALFFLAKVGSRSTHDTPEYTGRFKRSEVGGEAIDTGPGFAPREAPQYGKRPKVLSSRPAPASFASGGETAPVRQPTSPAVTRPPAQASPGRPGLRATRPDSGHWGS